MQGALLEVAERTDPGRDPDKQINEDSAGHRRTKLGHLLVVCDGMGGHALGQEASRLAVATIIQTVESAPLGLAPGAALAQAIVEAGRRVHQMGGTGPQAGRPGSTCVALLVHAGAVEVAHVGDSRAYFVRNGRIWPLTRDHSIVQQLLDQGAITPEQAVLHPEGNKITRALGMKPDTEVELRDPPLLPAAGDVLVLATDGLCDLVRTDEIGTVVAQAATLDLAAQNLVAMANGRGGHDNITVLLARVLPASAASATLPQEPLAPTIVEAPSAAPVPERTLVDRPASGAPSSAAAPSASPPSPMPTGAPFVPPPAPPVSPPSGTPSATAPFAPSAAAPITAPLPATALPPGARGHVPAPPPARTIPPGPPSRSGLFVAVLVTVVLFLGGILLWWMLRAP